MPSVFTSNGRDRGVVLGPLPAGMPVDLLANLQMTVDTGGFVDQVKLDRELFGAVRKLTSALNDARGKSDEEARKIVFSPDVIEPLMKVSKCPDYIVNRGHYFGVSLSDAQKTALIAYLRTFKSAEAGHNLFRKSFQRPKHKFVRDRRHLHHQNQFIDTRCLKPPDRL